MNMHYVGLDIRSVRNIIGSPIRGARSRTAASSEDGSRLTGLKVASGACAVIA